MKNTVLNKSPKRHNPDTIALIKLMCDQGYPIYRIASALNMSPSYLSILINWYFPELSSRNIDLRLYQLETIEALLRAGETVPSIAVILGKSQHTIRQYIYRNIPGFGGTSKLTPEIIAHIGALYRQGHKPAHISRETSVSEYYVRNAIGQYFPTLKPRNPVVLKDRIRKIGEMLDAGQSYKAIAAALGTSTGNVHSLIFRHFPSRRNEPRGGKYIAK
ncbi:hypothetical protein FBZ87_11196 [Nitrospirillum amazonense]|uniref:Uncharacterized protein n=1 Tax=Nitrospirillum amazonense TaxID=28077 RepID=A0A560JGC1_9PROT|nr:hypothetical protein [Nitrospirillum amazonense]TWB68394.1 hypothetical protein FBZ87_11196 [Nitrospirillum amazonense]